MIVCLLWHSNDKYFRYIYVQIILKMSMLGGKEVAG